MFWLLMIAAPIAAQAPVPPPPSWSPILTCDQTVHAVDRLICDTPALLAGARRVEMAYREALSRGATADSANLAADQEAWSKQRNLCVFKRKAAACVRKLQDSRTDLLDGGLIR